MPIGWSTQIMGGSLRQGLYSEVVAFSTTLAVQSLHLYKSNCEKGKIAASYFCILPYDLPKRLNYSIQVKHYATDWPLFYGKVFTFWQSNWEVYWHDYVIQGEKYTFMYFIVIFLWYGYLDLTDISITWWEIVINVALKW